MPSSDFTIQFTGDLASKNCDLALRRQRRPDKSWEPFFALTPAQGWTQVFLSPDKNHCQVSREVATRRMGSVISAFEGIAADSLTIARREGCILVSWEPLCLIEPTPEGIYHVKWCDSLLQRLNIDKLAATREFERLSTENAASRRSIATLVATAQWCP